MFTFKNNKGFTIIEMVVVIVISGIIGGLVVMIIGRTTESYHALDRRDKLTTSTRIAIERISREIRLALPNSICIHNGMACVATAENRLYFIQTKDAGRYQDAIGNYSGGNARNPLAITPVSASTFDVVSDNTIAANSTEIGLFAATNDWVTVYNINNTNVYAGNNRRQITAINPLNIDGTAGNDILRLTLSNNTGFPLHSPQRRFHIIENHSRIIYLQGSSIFLANSTNLNNPNIIDANNNNLLLENVLNLSFRYAPGFLQRSGLLHIDLTVEDEGEQIHIIHEAHVYNVP